MKIAYITVHLGGGVGKAIAGMALLCKAKVEQKIILLEKPCDMVYYKKILKEEIPLEINPTLKNIELIMREYDSIVINWWGHPKMIEFIIKLPRVACRLIIWNHINGCTYPYLPYEFLNEFVRIFFTTKFSLENSFWTYDECRIIEKKSSIIYGLGDFSSSEISPKCNYKLSNTFVVGYVGTLSYAKLNREFLDYYQLLVEKIPNIEFVMLGRVDKEIINDIKQRNLTKYFVFPGFVENTEKYYRSFDVFVYLLDECNYATTENVLLEAMAYALPIVVLKNPLEKNIIYDKKNGFLIDSKKAFVKCIMNLYENEELRKNIGAKAKIFVGKTYSRNANVQNFIRYCENSLQRKKRIYNFSLILGADPFEFFCYFAGPKSASFRAYVEANTDVNRNEVREVDKIFKIKGKSSVLQYNECFPNENNFKKIMECWKQE